MKSSKSNINFDFIEFEISETDLELYKKNITQGCIRRVDQLSANKWHYLLKADDRLLEVEIIYNRNSIKQFQCACGAHSIGKICKHVQLVCYWHVKTIGEKNETTSSSTSLAPAHFVHSSAEDLKYYLSFLSKQSRLNKEWLHFFEVARSTVPFPYQKYIALIENFYQVILIQTRNSASKIKYQLQFFEELYYISFYHYKQSNIEDAIHALLAGTIKLHEWNIKLDWKNQTRLIAINEKLHSALEQFLSSIIAPRALNKLAKMISELMTQPDYLILNEKSNLFKISKLYFDKDKSSVTYFDSLTSKLNLNIKDEYKFQLLDYLYAEYPEALKNYLIKIEINKSVYWVLSWMDVRKNQLSADYLLDLFSSIYEVSSLEMKSLIALKIAELYTHNHDATIGQLLIKYYLEVGQVKLLEVYFKEQEFTNKKFKLFLQNLETAVSNSELNNVQKLDFAFYSKQWPVLIDLFYEADDIELVLKYDLKIPEEYHTQLLDLYIKLTKRYLESYVGQRSHQKFEHITRHIKSIYKNKFHSAYVNEIKQLFPNRKLITQF